MCCSSWWHTSTSTKSLKLLRKAEELSTLLPPALQLRQNIIHFPSPPLQHSTPHEGYIATSVPGITDQTDNTNLKCHCSLTTICLYRLITQSTLMDPLVEGQETGAVAVVTRGSPLQPEVVATIKTRGRTFATSYKEEAAAIESALSWTYTNASRFTRNTSKLNILTWNCEINKFW